MRRLFVAAWPSEEARDRLRGLPTFDEPGVRRVDPGNWHVTLRFIGEADADEVRMLMTGVRFPRATATLGPAVEPLGRGAVVVPVDGLDELAYDVQRATMVVGERSSRPFSGHLTIARLKGSSRSRLVGSSVDATFPVEEIALVASERTPSGPIYSTVATFPTT